MKQWRHSFFADYKVWDIEKDQLVTDADIENFPQAQYAGWSPTGHNLIWVSNDKDIYYQTGDFSNPSTRRVTDTGISILILRHPFSYELLILFYKFGYI